MMASSLRALLSTEIVLLFLPQHKHWWNFSNLTKFLIWFSWFNLNTMVEIYWYYNNIIKRSYCVKYLRLWFLMKEMAVFKTADLSIFRLPVQTMEQSSLISMLNWSRLFFSLKFRDFLRRQYLLANKICSTSNEYTLPLYDSFLVHFILCFMAVTVE